MTFATFQFSTYDYTNSNEYNLGIINTKFQELGFEEKCMNIFDIFDCKLCLNGNSAFE